MIFLISMLYVIQVLDLTRGVGHWQVNSKAVGDNDSQLKKTDHRVAGVDRELARQILNIAKEREEEDKKLLEEVDREAINNNLTTMMMVNEW